MLRWVALSGLGLALFVLAAGGAVSTVLGVLRAFASSFGVVAVALAITRGISTAFLLWAAFAVWIRRDEGPHRYSNWVRAQGAGTVGVLFVAFAWAAFSNTGLKVAEVVAGFSSPMSKLAQGGYFAAFGVIALLAARYMWRVRSRYIIKSD